MGNALAPVSWSFTTLSPLITLYQPPRVLVFSAGTTTGYRFDATGGVIASRSYRLDRPSSASTSQRSKAVPGHAGAWFYVTNGVWAGYWVAESPRVYLPGIAELVTYSPARTFLVASRRASDFAESFSLRASA